VLVTGYRSGVQTRKDKNGGACRLYEGQEKGMQEFFAESEVKRHIGRHTGRIILNGHSINMIKCVWTTSIWLRTGGELLSM
jgi:hypothetical protein